MSSEDAHKIQQNWQTELSIKKAKFMLINSNDKNQTYTAVTRVLCQKSVNNPDTMRGCEPRCQSTHVPFRDPETTAAGSRASRVCDMRINTFPHAFRGACTNQHVGNHHLRRCAEWQVYGRKRKLQRHLYHPTVPRFALVGDPPRTRTSVTFPVFSSMPVIGFCRTLACLFQ